MTLIDRPPTVETTETTQTEPRPIRRGEPTAGRRFGYTVSIVINAVMLFIANNLMEWEWFPWLTNEYDRVLPWIAFSIGATMIVNAMYLAYDMQWFKSLTQAGLAVIAFIVTVRLFRIFPFDFSAYDFPWTGITEAILILAIVGTAIAVVVEGTRFIVRLLKGPSEAA